MTYFHSAMYDVRWRTVTRTLFESLHRLPRSMSVKGFVVFVTIFSVKATTTNYNNLTDLNIDRLQPYWVLYRLLSTTALTNKYFEWINQKSFLYFFQLMLFNWCETGLCCEIVVLYFVTVSVGLTISLPVPLIAYYRFRRGSTPVSTVLRKSVRFFIIDIF